MKSTKFFFSLLCITLLISFTALGQSNKEVDLKALDAYYKKMVKDWDLPAASIGIVKDGELVFTGNYGVLEVGKKKVPDENTLYAIASNSKAFTSAIIGMLVQEGKLKWDDKVEGWPTSAEALRSKHVRLQTSCCAQLSPTQPERCRRLTPQRTNHSNMHFQPFQEHDGCGVLHCDELRSVPVSLAGLGVGEHQDWGAATAPHVAATQP